MKKEWKNQAEERLEVAGLAQLRKLKPVYLASLFPVCVVYVIVCYKNKI